MSDGDVYRACAAIVVLRPAGNSFEVLLLHKPRKRDAWQLPQGGIEKGESVEEAAARELKEEAGIDVRVRGKSTQVYQYDFPPSYRRFRPDNVCGQRIEFVFALSEPDLEVVVDQSEIDAFVWVKPRELPKYLKRKEYIQFVEELVKEGMTVLKPG